MKIDLNKCYETMDDGDPDRAFPGAFIRQQIAAYVEEYDRQLQEQLAERHISHLCLAHGLTNEEAEAHAPQPHEEPILPCECAGRQRLMGFDMLYYDTRTQRWYRATRGDGRVHTAFCPLCDKRLP